MVVVDVVVPVVVALAVADEDHSGHGHGHGHVYDHDLLRLSRDCGARPTEQRQAKLLPQGPRPRWPPPEIARS